MGRRHAALPRGTPSITAMDGTDFDFVYIEEKKKITKEVHALGDKVTRVEM